MAHLLLGIDIGTSSSKGVLVRPDGTIAASAVRAHAPSLPRPGWADHDAEATWWGDLVAIARELAGAGLGPVAAVGVSGIGPAVLPVDASGAALRPAILYPTRRRPRDTSACTRCVASSTPRPVSRSTHSSRCGAARPTRSRTRQAA